MTMLIAHHALDVMDRGTQNVEWLSISLIPKDSFFPAEAGNHWLAQEEVLLLVRQYV